MNKFKHEVIHLYKQTLGNRYFWKVQWVNIMYIMKYMTKYRLIIIAYSLSMSYLYVELSTNSNEIFTDEQSKAIVFGAVSLFIVVRHLWFLLSVGRLFLPNSNQRVRIERWKNFSKQMLFILLVSSSNYLKTDVLLQHTSIEAIPRELIYSGMSAIFCYLSMIFGIHHFWKRLDYQMCLLDMRSDEPLDTDVCSGKVHFSSGWNEFVRVLAVGLTYKYSKNEDIFYSFSNTYAKLSDTEKEESVIVTLKYSFITRTLYRLTTAPIRVKVKKTTGIR